MMLTMQGTKCIAFCQLLTKAPPPPHPPPPTNDALHMHALRANYQAVIHRRSLSQWINVPSPSGHGWVIIDGKLLIKWMTQSCTKHSSQCHQLWLQAFEEREFKLFMSEGKSFLHGYVQVYDL